MLSCLRPVGGGRRSMIASTVETRNAGFLATARRRSTELRLPAISRDGSRPSNGKVGSVERVKQTADPLGPAFVFGKKDDARPREPGPSTEEDKEQHPQWRGSGNCRTSRESSCRGDIFIPYKFSGEGSRKCDPFYFWRSQERSLFILICRAPTGLGQLQRSK